MKRDSIPWSASPAGHPAALRGQALPAIAPVAVAFAVVLALYARTALDMASIWVHSTTYSHGMVVPLIAAWLAWRRRATLRALPVAPSWPWIVPFAAAGGAWLLGDLAQANAVTGLALVTMLVTAVPLVAGTRIGRALMFPLAYLYFAVPIGDFMLPQLMQWTADFTVWALQASGVPVYREGLQFVIPSGRWSVVEACSGVRYLIASLTVGALYAYLSYRSTWRRVAFIGVAIVVPIVANWVRAYGIVMLGHLSSNRIAVGVDHIIYGWLFFGLVVLAMFAIGARWRQDGEAVADVPALPPAGAARTASPWPAVAFIAVVAAAWPTTEWAITRTDAAPAELAATATVAGWTQVDAAPAWAPPYRNASATRSLAFRRGDAVVGVYVALYKDQSSGHKLVSAENALVRTDDSQSLRLAGAARTVPFDGTPVTVREERLRVAGELEIVALQWYVVDGQVTDSDVRARLYTLLAQLRGHGDRAASIVVHTDAGHAGALDDFVRAAGPVLSALAAPSGAAR